jgi:hypothetical protein
MYLTPDSWNKLREARGRLITWAVRKGCISAWDKWVPPLPHENINPGKIPDRLIVGMAGIQAAIQDGKLTFDRLSGTQAEQLARYGVNELNGFAPWFAALASCNRDAVRTVITDCVRGEWLYPVDRENVHDVVQRLIWHADLLMGLHEDIVLMQLRRGDPLHPQILGESLRILCSSGEHQVALAELAKQRLSAIDPTKSPPLWLLVAFQLCAQFAFDHLQANIASGGNWDDFIVKMCAGLFNRVDRRLYVKRIQAAFTRIGSLRVKTDGSGLRPFRKYVFKEASFLMENSPRSSKSYLSRSFA